MSLISIYFQIFLSSLRRIDHAFFTPSSPHCQLLPPPPRPPAEHEQLPGSLCPRLLQRRDIRWTRKTRKGKIRPTSQRQKQRTVSMEHWLLDDSVSGFDSSFEAAACVTELAVFAAMFLLPIYCDHLVYSDGYLRKETQETFAQNDCEHSDFWFLTVSFWYCNVICW